MAREKCGHLDVARTILVSWP